MKTKLLFALGLILYIFSRFYRLEEFPIYFFCDEAIQAVKAGELLKNGFRDHRGVFLPGYFQNGQYWNLSLSVWLQLIPVYLFGMEVAVTRSAQGLVTVCSAIALSLILKQVFKIRLWWLGIFIFGSIACWFFHSRTAFETVLMVCCYIWFFYFYLLYRLRNPAYIYPCALFGALTFYSYANGQGVMLLSAVFFLLSDLRYHLKNIRPVLKVIPLLLILAVPYIRFRIENPGAASDHLRILHSYWYHQKGLADKLFDFASRYFYGMSPQYWFLENEYDLVRHRMLGYAHIAGWMFPFFLIGALLLLHNFKCPKYRAILGSILAAPFTAALVDIAVTRVLLFVFPACLLITIGADAAFSKMLAVFPRLKRFGFSLECMAAIAVSLFLVTMLRDSLVNGPVWFKNYGMYGMAWGAEKVFGEAKRLHYTNNKAWVFVASDWTNATHILNEYFNPGIREIEVRDAAGLLDRYFDIPENSFFITTHEQVIKLQDSGIFKPFDRSRIIYYPDGTPGFYILKLEYNEKMPEFFRRKEEEKRAPVEESLLLNGEQVQILRNKIDIGSLENIFDGDLYTLMRGIELNPFKLRAEFRSPKEFSELSIALGTMHYNIEIKWAGQDGFEEVQRLQSEHQVAEPRLTFKREASQPVSSVEITIGTIPQNAKTNIHIRELTFK